jgi:hypothetical protein
MTRTSMDAPLGRDPVADQFADAVMALSLS